MDSLLIPVLKGVIILYSIILHEIAHGATAHGMGDPTAKHLGRLTLNPLPHLDLFGSVLLPILTLVSSAGRFVFGYAKPVPYNPLNLSDRRFGPLKVAVAGPAVNLLLAVVFGLFLRFLPSALQNPGTVDMLAFIVQMNLILAVFNLIPVPPLDGHWLLLALVPDRFYAFKEFFVRYGLVLFVFVLLFSGPVILPLIRILFSGIVGY